MQDLTEILFSTEVMDVSLRLLSLDFRHVSITEMMACSRFQVFSEHKEEMTDCGILNFGER